MPTTETMERRPQAILAGVDTGEYDMDISMEELRELTDSAEMDVIGVITQKRAEPDSGTYLGEGRLAELQLYARNSEADLIIFDNELTPIQLRNIEDACNCRVIDRTMLILEIFARRAVTSEGRLQVELAAMKYNLPRLTGHGTEMSRLGGGGGGGAGARRGAGETKLEITRRHIRGRISTLEKELEKLASRRAERRKRRKKDGVTVVAIVGYTNVGKSTLLNTLTQAGVLAEDKLFATLDPTSRALSLPDGRSVMLVDTVGLVRRLPHHLVEAFHSTLEEAACADLILNVCDASSGEMQEQLAVTKELLESLGAGHTPSITVLNKCDLLEGPELLGLDVVPISAKTGYGLDNLLNAIVKALPESLIRVKVLIPYTQGELENRLSAGGRVHSREYTENGLLLDVSMERNKLYLAEKLIQPPCREEKET